MQSSCVNTEFAIAVLKGKCFFFGKRMKKHNPTKEANKQKKLANTLKIIYLKSSRLLAISPANLQHGEINSFVLMSNDSSVTGDTFTPTSNQAGVKVSHQLYPVPIHRPPPVLTRAHLNPFVVCSDAKVVCRRIN